jgi:hypothetical protein
MLVGMETLHATVLYLPCLPSLEQFDTSDGVRRGETERSQDIKYDLTGLSSPMHPLSNRMILTHAHPCLTSSHRKRRPGYHVYKACKVCHACPESSRAGSWLSSPIQLRHGKIPLSGPFELAGRGMLTGVPCDDLDFVNIIVVEPPGPSIDYGVAHELNEQNMWLIIKSDSWTCGDSCDREMHPLRTLRDGDAVLLAEEYPE